MGMGGVIQEVDEEGEESLTLELWRMPLGESSFSSNVSSVCVY